MQHAIDLCHDPKAEPRVQRPRRIVRVDPKLQACVAALQRDRLRLPQRPAADALQLAGRHDLQVT